MFYTIRKLILNSLVIHLRITRNSLSLDAIKNHKEDINNVELVGTIYRHLFIKPSGSKAILVQTNEPENQYYYHMVSTRTTECLEIGQRVQLSGNLSSQTQWTDDKKLRQKLVIKAKEFHLCSKQQFDRDENRVQILATICSDIEHFSDCSSFTLSTRHTPKGGASAGIFKTEYHRVLVRDKSLIMFVRQNLKNVNRVLVDGKLSYTFRKNSDGKLRQSGYILANSIQRL